MIRSPSGLQLGVKAKVRPAGSGDRDRVLAAAVGVDELEGEVGAGEEDPASVRDQRGTPLSCEFGDAVGGDLVEVGAVGVLDVEGAGLADVGLAGVGPGLARMNTNWRPLGE